MVSSKIQHLISTVLLLFFFFLSPTFAQQSFRPKALVIPVQKDGFTTLQYIAKINQRTPLVPVNLVVDLGGQFLWVDCQNNYISSTYRPTQCRSAQCSLAKANGCGNCFSSPKPGCNNNTCSLIPDNTITHTATSGELAEDIISIQSTNGFNPTQSVAVSRFLFSCAPTSLLQGLFGGVSGASGMIGLGRTKISFPSQLASAFSFHKKFAICFSSSDGVVFFGDSPYNIFSSNVDASKLLTFTPLVINPVSTATASAFTQGESSSEYFIGVKTIKIDNKVVPIKTTLLTIDNKGVGGTKISTVNPYMVLEASIYKAVTTAFNKAAAARNITSSDSVEPFEFCYDLDDLLMPTIELVMENNVVWKMLGRNSMVNINDAVRCLGFMNGGNNTRTSIVIGGYQLEDNLLQFDLASSRLGFSGLLFAHQTGCVNFDDFTSTTL